MKTWKQKYDEIYPIAQKKRLDEIDARRDACLAIAPRWWQVLGFNLAIAGALRSSFADGVRYAGGMPLEDDEAHAWGFDEHSVWPA